MNSGSPLSFPVFSNKIKVGEIQRDFVGVFNETIIPLVLVGYEMIILTKSYPKRPRGIIVKGIYAVLANKIIGRIYLECSCVYELFWKGF